MPFCNGSAASFLHRCSHRSPVQLSGPLIFSAFSSAPFERYFSVGDANENIALKHLIYVHFDRWFECLHPSKYETHDLLAKIKRC